MGAQDPHLSARLEGHRLRPERPGLNEFGRQGWENAGTITPSFGLGQAIKIVIILKRPRA
jgi:hypothetical protein